jgi:RND family efflux transporter MFP subunit
VLRRATKGVKVKVSLASNRTLSVNGTVYEVSPIADPMTRTYRIRVALDTPPKELTIGATVVGDIEVLAGKSVTVPAAAMTREDGLPAVYLVDRGTSTLTRRKINVARFESDRVVVSSGLNAGEWIVTAGVSKLRPGQRVALDLPKESRQ